MKRALLLQNGVVFVGEGFGGDTGTAEANAAELVFTTAMTGYQETLTDPSYCGQIVVQTFPLIGNYGTNAADFEGERSFVSGYVVREHCVQPSNFRSEDTIGNFLKQQRIPGICSIDTRKLTRILREYGVMNAMLTDDMNTVYDSVKREEAVRRLAAYKVGSVVPVVSVSENRFCKHGKSARAGKRVVLMDFGYKHNIVRSLCALGCDVTVVPWNTDADVIINDIKPDGIMLSNGPGDPADCGIPIKNIRKLLFGSNIPLFGICLGHQLTAHASCNGGQVTYKLKYGHRGGNQPVKDLATGRTYITSQNHGYAVDGDKLNPDTALVSHINGNDGTCEGITILNRAGDRTSAFAQTVQYHPEAAGGPHDTGFLFDEFISKL